MEEKKEIKTEGQGMKSGTKADPEAVSEKPSRRGRSRRQPLEERTRKPPLLPKVLGAAGVLLIAAAAAGGFYFYRQVRRYESCFLPGTMINGMDMSGKSVEQVKAEIIAGLEGYALTIKERDGKEETISGEEIGLHSEFDGSLEKLLESQNPMDWWKKNEQAESIWIETMLVYDDGLFREAVGALNCMDEENMTAPENARISEYIKESKSYEVIPAVQGTTLVKEQAEQAISEAVLSLSAEVSLEEAECYTRPAVDTDDEGLAAAVAEMNKYVGAVVTHTFGDQKEVLDGDTISQWISVDGNTVTLDESQAAAYVKELASSYNTAYQPKTLKTSYGKTVTIKEGNYGWRINQTKETAAILEIIRNGEQQTREPEYSQKAASHGANDYGDTYVEINLTAQHLFFYKDGKLLVESDFVSGNESRGWATPAGAYPLTYKERNATLNGEGYSTPVSYWMPFNGGIGMHDASWRSSFGGTIYKTNGSHGCINLPPSVAKTIYENISAGMPVLCYHLEGTEGGSSSKPASETTAAAPETTAAPTVPETTAPAAPETTAAAPETTAPAASEPTESGTVPETAAPAQSEAATTAAPETTAAVPETSAAETSAPQPSSGGDREGVGPGFSETAGGESQTEYGPGM